MKRLAIFIVFSLISLILFSQAPQKKKVYTNGIYPAESAEARKERREFNKAQESINWNFKVVDGKVYWQRVFDFPESDSLKVINFFNNERYFAKIGNQYHTIATLANFNDLPTMEEPMVFQTDSEIYFFLDIKPGRYRITVSDIIWRGNVGVSNGIHITQEASLTMQDFINNNIYSGATVKKGIAKNTNICLIKLFDYTFTPDNTGILEVDF